MALAGLLGFFTATRIVATAVVSRVDFGHATIAYFQIYIVVDGVGEVGQLSATSIVIEDEVLVQSCVGLAHIPVEVLIALDGLCACWFNTRPVTVEVVHVSPLVECDGIPCGLVDDIYNVSVVLRTYCEFLHTACGHSQIDIVVDGVGEVGQLLAEAAVVEDEVLVQSGIGCAHVPIEVFRAVDGLCACRSNARPVTVEVVHVTPLIEVDVPSCLINHINHESVVFHCRLFLSALVVAFPTLSPDIGEGAYGRVVVVNSLHTLDGVFHALSG